jgi:hemolysin activation/secretion protein
MTLPALSTFSTRSALLPICASLLLVGLPMSVAAQSAPIAPRPDAGSVLQQQNSQPRVAPKVSPQVLPSGLEPKPQLQSLPSASVAVKGFLFTGNTVFGASELLPLVSALENKTATFTQLVEAADKVRQFYRTKGYLLAQAYLPQQDITSGQIEITVLEGYVGQVRVNPAVTPSTAKPRLKPSFAQSVLEANLTPGQVVSEASLERPLLLLSDLPGVDVKSTLGAGTAVGTADIDVALSNLPSGAGDLVTGSIDTDNQGSRFTGAWRVGANLNLNNATGYGDLLQVRLQTAPENTKTNFARIAWQTPLGYYGTQVGASYSQLNYALIKDFAALKAQGDAGIASVFVTHPFVRSRNFNINGALGFDHKSIEDRVLSTSVTETRRVNVARASVRGNWVDAALGGGFNAFGISHTNGQVHIAQALAQANDAAGVKTAGSFSKTNLDFLRQQNIFDNVTLQASVNMQQASKNLASAEKISLGGPNEVRAYPVGEGSGDQGYVGSVEARYSNPAWRLAGASTNVSAFYDMGHSMINKNPLTANKNTRSIAGAGLGFTVVGNSFNIRASIAWRTATEKPLSGPDKAPRLWLSASKAF